MIIVMKRNATEPQIRAVIDKLVSGGLDIHRSTGAERTILGALGLPSADAEEFRALPGVKEVVRITKSEKETGDD